MLGLWAHMDGRYPFTTNSDIFTDRYLLFTGKILLRPKMNGASDNNSTMKGII